MAKVKPDGHIWTLEFNRYVCFSFRGNRTIFGWDIENSIFDLEKSRSRSRPKLTKILSGNLQVRANNCSKNERNPKSCSKVIAWTRICGWRRRRRRTNQYKNIKSPPVYWGDLMSKFRHQHKAFSFTYPSQDWITIYMTCKDFYMMSQDLYEPIKFMYTAGKINMSLALRITCPVRHATTQVYVFQAYLTIKPWYFALSCKLLSIMGMLLC